jgi:hypothetical protein
VGIPGTKGRPWYVRKIWPSYLTAAVTAMGPIAALFTELSSEAPRGALVSIYVASMLAGVGLGAIKVAQARYKDAKDDRIESPDDLRGCLHVIHRTLASHKGVERPPEGWVRMTIHRLDGDLLEQSVNYVGSDDGGAGRNFSVNAGLIGYAARMKQPMWFHRKASMNFEGWAKYLVARQGMTEQAASSTRKDRFSFFAVPIFKPNGFLVRAVVYVDASETDFFDQETMSLIISGCEGLAAWVQDRYYSKS